MGEAVLVQGPCIRCFSLGGYLKSYWLLAVIIMILLASGGD